MGITDTVFGTPGQTTVHQTPGTRDPGYGFAKQFFNSLGGLMGSPYPTYQGNLDPGMAPTLQDAIRRAQGYAQSGPSEILQGAQGSLGRFMSPNFQNPFNALFGGAANYGGVDPSQRIYGGGPAGSTAFQNGMPDMAGQMQPGAPQSAPSGAGGAPQPGTAAGMAPSISAALAGMGQPGGDPAQVSDAMRLAMPGGAGSPPNQMKVMPPWWQPGNSGGQNLGDLINGRGGGGMPPIPGGAVPQPAPWGSGGNARRGFLDFMGGIGKGSRGMTPLDYAKTQWDKQDPSLKTAGFPNLPTGNAASDWREYWKSVGRPGAPGAGGGGRKPGGRRNRGRPSGPTDIPVAKPIGGG